MAAAKPARAGIDSDDRLKEDAWRPHPPHNAWPPSRRAPGINRARMTTAVRRNLRELLNTGTLGSGSPPLQAGVQRPERQL